MKTLYVLTVTILLFGAAAPETFAQRSGRNQSETDRNDRRDRDGDGDYDSNDRRIEERQRSNGGGILGDIFGTNRDRNRDCDWDYDGDCDNTDRRIEDRERRDRDDDYDRRNGKKVKKGKGPKFCENGQGHPVHGWEWCEDRGYDDDDDRYDRRRDSRDRDGDGDYDNNDRRIEDRQRSNGGILGGIFGSNRDREDDVDGRSGRRYNDD